MPGNRFDESLGLLPAGPTGSGSQLSVCAMGPVAPGDKILSMRVWLYQEGANQVSAASGQGGVHLGGHALSNKEKLPFTEQLGWMIQTELEGGASQFVKNKPALATAIAVIEHEETRPDGSKVVTKDVEHWSQGVLIRP